MSTHAEVEGRMHLHAFMEFGKPVDWTGVRAVTFNGVRPKAQPTSGRGTKVREFKNQSHFLRLRKQGNPSGFKIGTEVSCQINHTCMHMFCSLC